MRMTIRKIGSKIPVAVIALAILFESYTAKLWSPSETGTDFSVYYTAACLVRSHMSFHIYDGVKRNVNPQLIFADPHTVYAQTANSHGIEQVMLYLYPPTLADLLVPLTILSPSAAFALFNVFNLFMIVALSVPLARMLGMRSLGSVILVSIAVFLFRPTLNSIHWGEIVIMLLFLLILD